MLMVVEEDVLIKPSTLYKLLEETKTGNKEYYMQIIDDINKGCYIIKRKYHEETDEPFLVVQTPNAHICIGNVG